MRKHRHLLDLQRVESSGVTAWLHLLGTLALSLSWAGLGISHRLVNMFLLNSWNHWSFSSTASLTLGWNALAFTLVTLTPPSKYSI
jgi:hypothetical protein